MLRNFLIASSLLALAACSANSGASAESSSDLREVTTVEALTDFDQIAASVRSDYGALTRKEARYGFDFETMTAQYRARVAASHSEAEARGIFSEFLARFKDAHISLSAELLADDAHGFSLPINVMPIENTFVVYDAAPTSGVKIGDELLTIDGVSTASVAKSFDKYTGMPNAKSVAHISAMRITNRPIYAVQGLSAGATARLELRRADGSAYTTSLTWSEMQQSILAPQPAAPAEGKTTAKHVFAYSNAASAPVTAELSKMGARVPFFMTDAVKASLGATEVTPSAAALAKFKLTADAAASIDYFAATYTTGGKKVLLVRLPDYEPQDTDAALSYLRALFDDQQANVDALVLDQTHNPGGALDFAAGVVSLLAKSSFNAMVEEVHADRMWIQSFADQAQEAQQENAPAEIVSLLSGFAHTVDAAYSANKPLSAPIPMMGDNTAAPDDAHWTKPAMVLTDELSVSCADFVPLLVQANGIAPLFGERTMGGGGNVEEVATLTNTRAVLNLSRGLGTVYDPTGAYPDARFVEDNGVTPDVVYAHTLKDFRAGYVGYVAAFNAELLRRMAQ